MKGVPSYWRSPLPHYWVGKKINSLAHLIYKARDKKIEGEVVSQKELTPGDLVAALKIYICLVLQSHDKKQEQNVGKGKVRTTYEELILYLGLTRPMVARGLRVLENHGAVERVGTKPLIYRIKGSDQDVADEWMGFTWLPKGYIWGSKDRKSKRLVILSGYPNRGAAAAHGLALYLLLVSVAQRNSNVALITYGKMSSRLGLSNQEIRAAIDLLVNHGFISVLRAIDSQTFEALGLTVPEEILSGSPNAYLIKGLRARAYNENVNTLRDYDALSKGLTKGSG